MLDAVEGSVPPITLVAGFDDGDFEHGDGELAGFPSAGSLRQGFFHSFLSEVAGCWLSRGDAVALGRLLPLFLDLGLLLAAVRLLASARCKPISSLNRSQSAHAWFRAVHQSAQAGSLSFNPQHKSAIATLQEQKGETRSWKSSDGKPTSTP